MVLFLVPGDIAAGGVSGAAQLVHHYTGWPIGALVLAANLPLFYLGWRSLGGRRFLTRTVVAVALYSLLLDLLAPRLPAGLTQDPVLNALFGGVLGGAGMGLVFRAQGTTGGTDILARFLDRWRGVPLSQSYLLTDGLVVLGAGLTFGWERALYALVSLYLSGVAAEVAAEGPRVARTAIIITDRPRAVARGILRDLNRGVTRLAGEGMYTGRARQVLFCTVSRAQVGQLKAIIYEADPQAFVVIGQAHEALGEGFEPLLVP